MKYYMIESKMENTDIISQSNQLKAAIPFSNPTISNNILAKASNLTKGHNYSKK